MFGRMPPRLAGLVLLLALFPLFAFTYTALVGTAPGQAFNSDLIQPFMIMRDVMNDPSSILNWNLSPAIYVFPDYLIAFFVNLLSVGPIFSVLLNGAILYLLLALAGALVLRAAGLERFLFALVVMAAALLLAAGIGLLLPGWISTDMRIWTTTTFIHSGALIAGIAVIGLWTLAEMGPRRRPGLFVLTLVLAALAGWSDLIFIAHFIIPVGIATAIACLIVPDRERFGRALMLVIVPTAFFLFDLVVRRGIGLDLFIGSAKAADTADAGAAMALAGNADTGWIHDVSRNIGIVVDAVTADPVFALFLFATPIMAVRAAYLIWRAVRRHAVTPSEFIEITLAGAQAAAIIAPVVIGLMQDIWGLRYALPIVVLPIIWLLIVLRPWLARLQDLRRPWAWGAGLWASALAISLPAALAALPEMPATHPVAACMQEMKLDAIYAWYWHTKLPMFLSDYGVHIVQLEDDITLSHWNINDAWATRSVVDGKPFTVRAIDMTGLQSDAVENVFGTPDEMRNCNGVDFWLYDTDLPPPPERP